MYDLAFESLRKSTESAIQVQQEMFRTWGNFWGGGSSQVQSIQKWADTFGDLLRKQKQTLEAQYNGGLKIIEQAPHSPHDQGVGGTPCQADRRVEEEPRGSAAGGGGTDAGPPDCRGRVGRGCQQGDDLGLVVSRHGRPLRWSLTGKPISTQSKAVPAS